MMTEDELKEIKQRVTNCIANGDGAGMKGWVSIDDITNLLDEIKRLRAVIENDNPIAIDASLHTLFGKPLDYWREMHEQVRASRLEYVITTNALLRAEVEHLRGILVANTEAALAPEDPWPAQRRLKTIAEFASAAVQAYLPFTPNAMGRLLSDLENITYLASMSSAFLEANKANLLPKSGGAKYYTPPEVYDAAAGSGVYLRHVTEQVISNPPPGESD